MTELDLSAYDPLCDEHVVAVCAKLVVFDDLNGERAWNVDLGEGTISFEGVGSLPVQLLGTFDRGDGTFLWSWANPGAEGWSPSVTAHARALRDRGAPESGLACFGEPKIADGWVGFHELGLVASGLAGQPLAIRDAGGPLVLMLVDTAVPEPDQVVWPRVLMTLAEIYRGPLMPALERYLSDRDALIESSERSVRGRFGPGAELTVELDEQGRIARIDGALSAG